MGTGDSGGLLKRASLLRGQGEYSLVDSSLEADSGISAEDRREIRAKIDEITKGAQLSAESRIFSVKAQHRGLFFPIVVNIIALIVAAGGLFGLSLLFHRKEAALSESETAVSSAEGRLLAALKKESASQLEAKDHEIIDFQTRIGALDKERGELAASIDQRVRTKETELRASLQAELDKEKTRLLAGGLSEASAQTRLAKYEADKTAQFQRDLSDYQRKASDEKSVAEANYARVRDEYQKNIASLAEERQRIQAESSRREAELKSKSATLESEKASAQAGLALAQAELTSMAEEKRKSDAAEDRIVGLYASVHSALRDRRYADATVGAATLRAYLDDPSVVSLPSLSRRRDADVFAAESIAALAKTELDRQSLDSNRLIAQAELLDSIRASSRSGSAALKAGEPAVAEAKYREALSAVSEILAAHEYFTGRSSGEEAARRAKLDEALSAAGQAYKRGELESAADYYGSALAYLPVEDSARSELALRLGEAGALARDSKRRASDTKAARAPLAAAKAELSGENWTDALEGYLGVLVSYPSADQRKEAVAGIEAARVGLDADSLAQSVASSAEAASLKADIERLTASLSAENDRLAESARIAKAEGRAELESVVAARDARIAELEKLLAAAQSASASSASSSVPGGKAGAEDLASLKAENARLSAAAASYDAILSSYASYQKVEADVPTALSATSQGLLESRARLDDFLAGPEAKAAFPDLRDRVARFQAAFQEAGAREVLYNAMDISENATRIKDGAERTRYFKDVESRYASSPAMLAYIKSLQTWIK